MKRMLVGRSSCLADDYLGTYRWYEREWEDRRGSGLWLGNEGMRFGNNRLEASMDGN